MLDDAQVCFQRMHAPNFGNRYPGQHAKLLGEDVSNASSVEAPVRAIDAVRRIIASLGLPTRLREFDLSLDEMIEVAGAARSFDMMNYLPRVVSTEDIYELIKSAF